MNKAFAVNGFVRRYRWTLLRRATELLVLICFTGTARWGWEVFGKPLLVGDLSSSRILGVIPLDDPLALFERLCAGIIPTASAAIGALLITLFYGLLGSRTFCGWVCPMNFVVETAAWLRRKLNLPADAVRLPRLTRYATLAGVLLASILTGSAAFETVSPQAFLWRDIIFGTGLSALSAVLTVFALELGLMKDGWCGHLCPLGAFWSLAGRASPRPIIQIAFIDEHCTRCADCLKVCPEKQVIRFKELAQTAASRLGTVSTAAAALKSALKMHCIFVWAAKKQNLPEIHYDPLSSYFRLCFCRRCCRINGVSYARLCRRQRNLWCPRLSSASGERLSADHG